MNKIFLIITLLPLLAFTQMSQWEQEKDDILSSTLNTVSEIKDLAQKSRSYSSQEINTKIESIIKSSFDSEKLFRISIITGIFYFPGNASHSKYDEPFDYVNIYCARLLSKRNDYKSKSYLMQLKSLFGTDGHGSELYNQLILNQNAIK